MIESATKEGMHQMLYIPFSVKLLDLPEHRVSFKACLLRLENVCLCFRVSRKKKSPVVHVTQNPMAF